MNGRADVDGDSGGGSKRSAAAARLAAGFGLYLAALFFGYALFQRLAPKALSLNLAGHPIVLHDLHHRFLTNYLVLSLIVPALLLIELTIVGWPNSSLRRLTVLRRPSSMSDLTCFLIDQTPLMGALRVVASLGAILISADGLHSLVQHSSGLNLSVSAAPLWAQIPLYFLAYGFFDYWAHRLDHSRWFWPLHRYHHAINEFCIISSVRVHPAAFTRLIQQALPAVILGAPPEVVVGINLVSIVYRYVIHSNIDSNFGWFGRYVLQSPTHHRLHHSLEAGADSGHFGIAPLWDHLFGTWLGEADQSLIIGVDTSYRHGVWLVPDLWRDYCEFWSGLFALRPVEASPRPGPAPARAIMDGRRRTHSWRRSIRGAGRFRAASLRGPTASRLVES